MTLLSTLALAAALLPSILAAKVETCATALHRQIAEGEKLRVAGRYAEAEARYRAVIHKSISPGCPEFDFDSATERLGLALYEQAHYAEAELTYRALLAAYARKRDSESTALSFAQHGMALVLNAQGHYADAYPLLRSAARIQERELGERHPETLQTLRDLACLLVNRQEYARAEPILRRVAAGLESGTPPPGALARCYGTLAAVHLEQHRPVKAREYLQRARAAAESDPPPNPTALVASEVTLIEISIGLRDYATARELLARTMSMALKTLGPDHPLVGQLTYSRGELHYLAGRYTEAETDMQSAIRLQERLTGPESRAVAVLLRGYALMLRAAKRSSEARRVEAHAKGILRAL